MWQVALGWHAIEFAQTSPILKFYIWFRFRPYHCSRHVILHQSEKFYPNRTTLGKKMTSCRFSRWRTSAILDFKSPIMGSLKSPCTTSYTGRANKNRTPKRTLIFRFTCKWKLYGLLDVKEQSILSVWGNFNCVYFYTSKNIIRLLWNYPALTKNTV